MKDISILERLDKGYLVFDGPMGTMMQKAGLKTGDIPEDLNIDNPEMIQKIQYDYCMAGADVISANTFGANRYKLKESSYTVDEIVKAAILNAEIAIKKSGRNVYIALDMSPIGQLIEPNGTLSFEEAYEIHKEVVEAGIKYGVDLVIIETMLDIYELKAAILAIKENSDVPIFATMTFEEKGRTLSGTDPKSMVATLEGLGVDALGVNCSFGPKELYPIVKTICDYSSTPVIVQANHIYVSI